MQRQIAINARFAHRRVTGVERYASAKVAALQRSNYAHNLDLRTVKPGKAFKSIAGHLWEQVALPRRIRPGELLWSPANTGPLAIQRQVLTLHDVSVIEHPEWFAPQFAAWYGWLLPRLARRVQRVITVSAFSRQRIIATLGLPAERVVQINAAVEPGLFHPKSEQAIREVRMHYGLPECYLLFLGSLEPRKNLPVLLQAWNTVQNQIPECSLVIAGGASPVFRSTTFEKELPRTYWIGYVAEADLAALYSGARAFVLPSFYEGFGLATLEAMACGTPVIVAQAGALPELVDQAGLYFQPNDTPALIEAILNIAHDDSLRAELAQRGRQRAQDFTWEEAARKAWEVFEEALA
jgi:glycosyltransferase involved in cell wall biosynthesis